MQARLIEQLLVMAALVAQTPLEGGRAALQRVGQLLQGRWAGHGLQQLAIKLHPETVAAGPRGPAAERGGPGGRRSQ